ncbi:DUF2786 domain-containing protein [Solicola gregarius]|uniref:DUF2786 domain-containing protein n=1 Tax=Solicola gregarius TaxID=2908642 RepID=A0AA46TL37_9ACTN|nr:DUF2786 domain-containing protein [Solicola gregarius]UYM07255.1 DUF2786 domain-containing protein [Solicola gregarius]
MEGPEIARTVLSWVAAELPESPRRAGELARTVLRLSGRIGDDVLSTTTEEWLAYIVSSVVASGWAPTDLAEIVRRRGTDRQLPILSALLRAETDRHPDDQVSPLWNDDLDRIAPPRTPDLLSTSDLENVFELVTVLVPLPPIEHTVTLAGSVDSRERHEDSVSSSKHLNRVRALLAKAESTESAQEAEALSAKAQELISRYALDRLLDRPLDDGDRSRVDVRRIWIDAPYVSAKATLIHQVCVANRCRAVFTEKLEFMTVLGGSADVDAVELMTASLLVQAQTAMLAHGSRSDGWGTSRTRSFRRSFLIAYAGRIGERLRTATDDAVEETGEAKALVPVLKRQAAQIDAACAELFPRLGKTRRSSVSNAEGLLAGRAAADRASLNAHKNVTAGP